MWVITESFNDYDQHGDYFVAVFKKRPSFKELQSLLNTNDVTTGKLLKGGGRQASENSWYYLTEIKDGELYKHSF